MTLLLDTPALLGLVSSDARLSRAVRRTLERDDGRLRFNAANRVFRTYDVEVAW